LLVSRMQWGCWWKTMLSSIKDQLKVSLRETNCNLGKIKKDNWNAKQHRTLCQLLCCCQSVWSEFSTTIAVLLIWLINKELPSSIDQLDALQKLDLSRCSKLKELPSCIGQLNALQELDLSKCSELKELPSSISELNAL
jgi:Leucine-rich repeat (LRR) protein